VSTLAWFGRATRLVYYSPPLAASLSRLPGRRRALDAQAHRIQRSRSEPGAAESIRSDVVAVAGVARDRPRCT
jgi:hypothetical protein